MTEEFEAWAKRDCYDLDKWEGEYESLITVTAYDGWEAGRAALKREQAEKAANAIHEAMEQKKGD